jgi:two-component system nitrate/nitrite response regulator NarL
MLWRIQFTFGCRFRKLAERTQIGSPKESSGLGNRAVDAPKNQGTPKVQRRLLRGSKLAKGHRMEHLHSTLKKLHGSAPVKRHLPVEKSSSLTRRERQITRVVSEGVTNKEIGRRLRMAEGTVKVHLHHIYRKLGIANRTALAVLAQTKTFDAA